MQRAVLYARVSGDDRGKDSRNLTGQIDMGRKYATDHGYEVVAQLAEDDRGASGAAFELPQLKQVLEMASKKQFDVLVVREIDRLSRSLAKQLIVEEELRRAGVRIEYVLGAYPASPEGDFMKNIRASVAEYERLKILERSMRGKVLKAKKGSVMVCGSAPFGYRQEEHEGKWVLAIEESEAQIVRLIFNWYTRGDGERGPLSLGEIQARLTDLKVPTAGDKSHRYPKKRGKGEWARASIRDMIRNETYAGTWHFGKERRSKTYTGTERIAVQVTPIVTRQTWEAAQVRMEENRETRRRKAKHDYLMSGRLLCAECGGHAVGNPGGKYHYYHCRAGVFRNTPSWNCEMRTNFRSDVVDQAVWEWVKLLILDDIALQAGLARYQGEQDKASEPLRERLGVIEGLLAENRTQLERLLDLYLDGGFARDMLIDRKSRLESTIGALEREREGLLVHLEVQTLTDEQLSVLHQLLAEVRQGIDKADHDFALRRLTIERLGVEATLAVENSERVVHARCIVSRKDLWLLSTST